MTSESIGTVTVSNVSKTFRLYHDRARSLKSLLLNRAHNVYESLPVIEDVSFTIDPGDTVALVGANGCGKSTMLKMIAGILQPTKGTIDVRGKVSSLLELGAGFQPDYSGVENIFLNGSILGLSKKQIQDAIPGIVDFSELEQFIDTPVRNYSSGMYMRLAFSIAVNVDPDVLIVDEVLAVGDERFQRKCFSKLREFQKNGKTIIFVSHDPSAVRELCSRAILLHKGRVVDDGPPDRVLNLYRSVVESGVEMDSSTVTHDAPEKTPADTPSHVVQLSGDSRYGTSKLTFTHIEFRTDPELPDTLVPLDGIYHLELQATAHANLEGPIFGFTLKRWVAGQWVTAYETNTKWQGISTDSLHSGDEVTVTFDGQLVLGRGQYAITVASASYDASEFYDVIENTLQFHVTGPETWAGIANLYPEIRVASSPSAELNPERSSV